VASVCCNLSFALSPVFAVAKAANGTWSVAKVITPAQKIVIGLVAETNFRRRRLP